MLHNVRNPVGKRPLGIPVHRWKLIYGKFVPGLNWALGYTDVWGVEL